TENVRPQDAIRLGIGQYLHAALAGADGPRTPVRFEREHTYLVLDAGLLELLFGLADTGNLGMGVDDIGNRVVVDMAVSGHDRFHTRDAFLLGLVRQHGAANDVTQRIDAIHVGPETFVDLHEATLVLLDAQLLQPQSIRVRHAAYRHQHAVAGDGF